MTSPVDFISGLQQRVSTPVPSSRRNQLNNEYRLLHRDRYAGGRPHRRLRWAADPLLRNCAMLDPRHDPAYAPASGTAVALDTNGTVRLARGLASST